jgi:endo-1,4-beta-xylanase
MTIETRATVVPGTVVPLWANGAPGSEERASEAEIVEGPAGHRDWSWVRNVHNPSLTLFPAPAETATGLAVIVAPGGGHQILAIEHEGYRICDFLNSVGISAFLLKYRLPREEGSPYQLEVHTLADAQRAVRTVRHNAAAWGADPHRIVMIGFSAGAAVTVLAGAIYDAGDPSAADPIDSESSRLDAQALIYGGGRQVDLVSFTPDTPPAFLCGADDDRLVTEFFPLLYTRMKQGGVPLELHVYASGGHGFGIKANPLPVPSATTWQLRFVDWLGDRGLLRV